MHKKLNVCLGFIIIIFFISRADGQTWEKLPEVVENPQANYQVENLIPPMVAPASEAAALEIKQDFAEPTSATISAATPAATSSSPIVEQLMLLSAQNKTDNSAGDAAAAIESQAGGASAAALGTPFVIDSVNPDANTEIKPADKPVAVAGNNWNDFDAWQGPLAVFLILAGLGGVAGILIRGKMRGLGIGQKPEKTMQIISTLAISPKRQILLVKIKGQEIALACTEQGIQFLTEIGAPQPKILAAPEYRTEPRQQISAKSMSYLEETPERNYVKNSERSEIAARAAINSQEESAGNDVPAPQKSEVLLSALKRIKDKAQKQGTPSTSKSKQTDTQTETKTSASKSTATFPKYLAKNFEQESKRDLSNKPVNDDDEVESVTNMIRERLKNMQQMQA